MPSWPSTLPSAPLAARYREMPPDTALRTEMDAGPAKMRRRTTAAVRPLEVEYLLSAAQVAALDSFYTDDLLGGTLGFDFTHPRVGTAETCRFCAAPSYVPVNGDHYRAVLELEILP